MDTFTIPDGSVDRVVVGLLTALEWAMLSPSVSVSVTNRAMTYQDGTVFIHDAFARGRGEGCLDISLTLWGDYLSRGQSSAEVRPRKLIRLTVTSIPDTEAAVRVVMEPCSDDKNLKKLYKEFRAQIAQHWPTSGLARTSPDDRSSGRRPLKANDWAYHEYKKGRSIDAILPEWEKMRGISVRTLSDPRDSLTKALRSRANKEKNTKGE